MADDTFAGVAQRFPPEMAVSTRSACNGSEYFRAGPCARNRVPCGPRAALAISRNGAVCAVRGTPLGDLARLPLCTTCSGETSDPRARLQSPTSVSLGCPSTGAWHPICCAGTVLCVRTVRKSYRCGTFDSLSGRPRARRLQGANGEEGGCPVRRTGRMVCQTSCEVSDELRRGTALP